MVEHSSGLGPRRFQRLRRDAEFERVRAEGQSWSSSLLVLRAAPAAGTDVRIGTIASKRLGKAVRRNRIRRLIREAIWQVRPRLKPGWDIVIVARSKLQDASSRQVQQALEELVSRAGLVGGPPDDRASTGGSLF